ncbi:MAG: hypothetical protein KKA51_00245, partial [Nanoarchaeota archaeon]|nr:hypothetical protein [Nanoarchaeota archaeon]
IESKSLTALSNKTLFRIESICGLSRIFGSPIKFYKNNDLKYLLDEALKPYSSDFVLIPSKEYNRY